MPVGRASAGWLCLYVGTDHSRHKPGELNAVVGRIAAPPQIEPVELLRQLDQAIAERPPCRIYALDLCEAAGLAERAELERRRMGMIVSARGDGD